MPAMTARQVRITRHFALGIFSLIIICNLSWVKSVRTSVLADAVDGVADVLPRAQVLDFHATPGNLGDPRCPLICFTTGSMPSSVPGNCTGYSAR